MSDDLERVNNPALDDVCLARLSKSAVHKFPDCRDAHCVYRAVKGKPL
jgi:hypothetical protein